MIRVYKNPEQRKKILIIRNYFLNFKLNILLLPLHNHKSQNDKANSINLSLNFPLFSRNSLLVFLISTYEIKTRDAIKNLYQPHV